MASEIHVFVNDVPGTTQVGVVMVEPAIIEYDGVLQPGMLVTPDECREIADALNALADEADSTGY